jgi:hypothetical protein
MLVMQHLFFPQLLPHVWDQTAVFEDGEDLRREGGKVILIIPRKCKALLLPITIFSIILKLPA